MRNFANFLSSLNSNLSILRGGHFLPCLLPSIVSFPEGWSCLVAGNNELLLLTWTLPSKACLPKRAPVLEVPLLHLPILNYLVQAGFFLPGKRGDITWPMVSYRFLSTRPSELQWWWQFAPGKIKPVVGIQKPQICGERTIGKLPRWISFLHNLEGILYCWFLTSWETSQNICMGNTVLVTLLTHSTENVPSLIHVPQIVI